MKESPSGKKPAPSAPAGRRAVEEKLRRSEERYRRIFENIQDIYYEVTLDGTVLEISPSVANHFAFRREELIGKAITGLYADPARREAFLQEIRERGTVRDFEIELQDRTGARITCAIIASLLPASEGQPQRIVGSMRDISERKRAEQAMREREEELSIQSRNLEELNTALKVLLRQREEDRTELQEQILANVKALILPCIAQVRACRPGPPQQALLDTLERRIQGIVSPFLHRIQQAYFDLTPQEVRVAECVKDGKTTKEIAGLLGISTKTVDYHRDRIRRKMGLKNRHTSLRTFLLKLS
jgi:PAS domain S-box-containing protein